MKDRAIHWFDASSDMGKRMSVAFHHRGGEGKTVYHRSFYPQWRAANRLCVLVTQMVLGGRMFVILHPTGWSAYDRDEGGG